MYQLFNSLNGKVSTLEWRINTLRGKDRTSTDIIHNMNRAIGEIEMAKCSILENFYNEITHEEAIALNKECKDVYLLDGELVLLRYFEDVRSYKAPTGMIYRWFTFKEEHKSKYEVI